MKYRSSSQAFKFDIATTLRLCKIISTLGLLDTKKIGEATGENIPKVNENIQYLRFCDLVTNECLTSFGFYILKLKEWPEFIEPLLLFKLGRGCQNGGHYYFSRLLNDVLYDIAFEIDNKKSTESIVEACLATENEKECCKDNDEGKRKNFRQALNMGLSDSVTGFGKMGMVVEKEGNFEIVGYIPHNLVTAFILYDNWPQGRTALKLSELVTADYLPGKIFFMGRELLYQQLHELAAERLVFIEQQAGLDQLRLNPEISSNDILDRMVEYAERINAFTTTGL